jgi:hypothetical protein
MAIKTFIGDVVKVLTRKVDGRNGPITAYSVKVAKPDGEEYDEWIGFGFKKPDVEEGDSVKISAKKENGFWKAVDVEVTETADQEEEAGDEQDSGESGSTVPAEKSAPAASSKKISKQQYIHYQNSRTAALELVALLLQNKAAPLAATEGKAGTAKRFEEVVALVDKLTVKYFHDLETFRLVNDIEDAYEAPAPATGAFDADETTDDDE